MKFEAEGLVISVRKHGETSAILDAFSAEKGRHKGLVHGGVSRRQRPVLQPGNLCALSWRARLEENLGYYTVELIEPYASLLIDDRLALSALNSICALITETLPEKQPVPQLYEATKLLISLLDNPDVWPALYVRWESALLQALGYGLDLTACAATGVKTDLTHVSPRSGRAVSREAAQPYLDRMFALPSFLLGEPIADPDDIGDGLKLTGHFLETRAQWARNRTLPEARAALVEQMVAKGVAVL